MKISNATEHYIQTHLAPGTDLYYATLYLKAEVQLFSQLVLALHAELLGVLTTSQEHEIRRAKLMWWHDEIERMLDQSARHPLTQGLAPYIDNVNNAKLLLPGLVSSLLPYLESQDISDVQALHHIAHSMFMIRDLLLHHTNEDRATQEYLKQSSFILLVAHILRNFNALIKHDQCFIPKELAEKHNLDLSSLYRFETSKALCACFTELAENANEQYLQLQKNKPKHIQRSHTILLKLSQKLINEIRQDGFQVFKHQLELTPLRKWWASWRTKP